ncbi:MAG: phosphoenolpyruvate--protein phosphotransferase [Candidatus Zixiibacteriota bacterium]
MIRTARRLLKGVGVSPGIALGRALVLLPGETRVVEVAIPPNRVAAEIESLERAVAETMTEVRQLRDAAGRKLANPVVKIFDAQMMIAGDYEFIKQVKEGIAEQKRNAAYVYSSFVEKTTLPLKQSPDQYLRQMAVDIESVSHRVLAHLEGGASEEIVDFPPDSILVGKNFTPGQVLSYRNRKVAGFLVSEGGKDSHMALIARSLMVPVIVAEAAWTQVNSGSEVILDGSTGQVVINPNDEDWAEYQKLKKRQGPAAITRIRKLPKYPPLTADGKPVSIAANLELPGPVDQILSEQGIPVGLYRTEFLYLQSEDFPDEEKQFEAYSQIAEQFAGGSVMLRTFDLGSDKMKPGQENILHEANPALGWRGIRPMLEMPEVFKDQIRAILRASTRKNIRIMLPMVSDIWEYDKARKLVGQAMLELRRSRVPFDEEIPVGIMVEVPSAALMADLLAEKVDFISIGTNDLTQYTMSADRTNERVASLYSAYHPSVLHLIKMTVDACKKHRKPVSICGEVAGDLLALPLFLGMGVDQLSMNPAKIFDMCRLVRKIDSQLVRHLVGSVMASTSAAAVTRRLESYRTALEK